MAYEVLARKWRPQQFDDVVGQEHVITTLKNAIAAERVAHAYLFVGPRGVGKTTIARIFARALNCVNGPAAVACGVCNSCREISGGNNLDVQEIDGASNRKIDDIRELRDNVRFAPLGRYKIYIIDEVHMLTNEAFNALLKTLEEPPPHLKFFMATTDPQKIPGTILSRCQRFDLRRIPARLIIERLELIARDEKVEVERDALLAVARAAEGGLRDAESALDQLISFQGKKITEADVLAVFGMVSRQALENLSDAMLAGDILNTVKNVAQLDDHGKDMQRLLVELLEHFRNLLVYKEVGAAAAQLDLTAPQLVTLERQAVLAGAAHLLRIIEILMDTVERLRYALSRRTLVETALIRCARLADALSLDALLEQIQALRQTLATGTTPGMQVVSRAPTPHAVPRAHAITPEHQASHAGAAPVASVGATPAGNRELGLATSVAGLPPPVDTGLAHLRRDWHLLMERAGRIAIGARKALLDAAPIAVAADKVVIGVDAEFADRLEQLKQPRNYGAVLKALEATLNRKVAVEFELRDDIAVPTAVPVAAPPLEPASASADAPAARPADDGDAAATGGQTADMRKWMNDDKVQKVLDVFNGSILEIRE